MGVISTALTTFAPLAAHMVAASTTIWILRLAHRRRMDENRLTMAWQREVRSMAYSDGTVICPDGGKMGPYCNVWGDALRNYGDDQGRLRLFISGAYDAMGLIGTEYNGIVVLDNKTMRVVADCVHGHPSSGFYQGEPLPHLKHQLAKMLAAPSEELYRYLQDCERYRGVLEAPSCNSPGA